jgi:hypothetical protein
MAQHPSVRRDKPKSGNKFHFARNFRTCKNNEAHRQDRPMRLVMCVRGRFTDRPADLAVGFGR